MIVRHPPFVAATVALLLLSAIPAAAQDRLAITSVAVVDVDEGVIHRNQTIIVSGDRITAVGDSDAVELPAGGMVIDGSGKFLIPGLWDMHAHASRGGRAARFWPLLVAHGVTGMRDTGSYADSLLYWRARSELPGAVAPRIEIVSPSLTGDSATQLPGMGGPHQIRVADAASAVAVVDSLAELGLHVIKVYDGLPREAYFAVAERTRELGMSFIGHVPLSVSLAEASDAGQRSFEHVTELLIACVPGAEPLVAAYRKAVDRHGATSDAARAAVERLMGALAFTAPEAAECGSLLERMITNQTWLTPTLTLYRGETQASSFDGDPRMRWVPPALAERWREGRRMTPEEESQFGSKIMDNALRTVAIAHGAGVGILAGTDASDLPYIFAGSSLHDELSMYVEAGLTPLEALQTATLNPARFLHRTDDLGTVEVGKLASLVLLEANPLEDIVHTQRIAGVILRGRHLDREALDGLLEDAERVANRPPDFDSNELDAAFADSIIALGEEWTEAWNELNPERLMRLHAEDLLYGWRSGFMTRESFQHALREYIVGHSAYTLELAEPRVRRLGADAAVLSFLLVGEEISEGVTRPFKAAVTLVVERQSGEWTVIQVHESEDPPQTHEVSGGAP